MNEDNDTTLLAIGFFVLLVLASAVYWLHQPSTVPATWPGSELRDDYRFAP